MVGDTGAMLNVGVVFTVTTTVFDDVLGHPAALVPLRVYVVVVTGLTLITEVVAPVLHEYVAAPLPVSVVELPEHIVGDPAVAFNVGVGFTVTTTVLGAAGQPVVVPFTV